MTGVGHSWTFRWTHLPAVQFQIDILENLRTISFLAGQKLFFDDLSAFFDDQLSSYLTLNLKTLLVLADLKFIKVNNMWECFCNMYTVVPDGTKFSLIPV